MSVGKKEKINVLSLFDGMSCGQIALNKVGIEYENYFASEIDKYAIQVTQKNYPNTKQLGSVTELDGTTLPKIDLMYGGSPCQDLSSSNVWTEQKGLEGKKSSLFGEFVRLLKEVKPTYFLLENVGSAKNSDIEIIDRELGVKGIKFNSKLVLPQNRNRVYWTNIPFELPTIEMTLTMQDLLETNVDDKYYITQKMYDCIISPATKGWQSGKMDIDLKIARPLTATMHKMHRADTDNYITGIAPQGKTNVRRLTPIECERLQGVKDNYTDCVSDTQRYRMLGNGWTVDAIAHIFSFLKGGEIFNNFSKENVYSKNECSTCR
jgi:DNA-cytosine methyltransferase